MKDQQVADLQTFDHRTPANSLLTKELIKKFHAVRQQSLNLCQPLQPADYELQADTFVSPIKWHLAHTSWFFETFILKPYLLDYQEFNSHFAFIFNSYYNGIGQQYSRHQRGLLSRPSVDEIVQYRDYIDQHITNALENSALAVDQETINNLILLGLNHEQQHQELMLTDLKYCFSFNPLLPAYQTQLNIAEQASPQALNYIEVNGGMYNLGFKQGSFCFDNELPRHQNFVRDFLIADRLITNQEFLLFIQDGGYQQSNYWLSDGWRWLQENNIQAPLYWQKTDDGKYHHFCLDGIQPLNPSRPVTHISFYEAEAYARWAGKRLATEFEWEVASKLYSQQALSAQPSLEPMPAKNNPEQDLQQLFGHCWQWTQSSYSPYPGFKAAHGAIGEYNGKFMCNQMVLRGSSCVTQAGHARNSYRNFFYPHERWQYTGIRLAADIS